MKFEWDTEKAASNLKKHGVSFELAALAFLDHKRIEFSDDRKDYGEVRLVTIAHIKPAFLCVVYTIRNQDTTRIISARKANENERKQYRQANA